MHEAGPHGKQASDSRGWRGSDEPRCSGVDRPSPFAFSRTIMRRSRDLLLPTTLAFAGGLVSGLLLAPQRGRDLRAQLLRGFEQPSGWMEDRRKALEEQVARLEAQLHTTSEAFAERFRELTGEAVDAYRPSLADTGWGVQRGDLARDLRFMPRR